MKRYLISSVFLLASITACKKDTDKHPSPQQPMALLTSGEWQLIAFGFDDDSSGYIEDYENMASPCHLDNTIRYFANGTGISFENELVCALDTSSPFEWKFIDEERVIEVYGVRMDLHKLTDKALHFKVHEPVLKDPLHTIYRKVP